MRPSWEISLEAWRNEGRKRKFSATEKDAVVLVGDLVHARRSEAVAMSFAMGFSARTCLPDARAFLMYEGWARMGRL